MLRKKNIHRKRRTSVKSLSQDAGQLKWRWILLIAFFTIIFSFCSILVFQKNKMKDHLVFSPYLARLTTWIKERKIQLQTNGMNKAKKKAKLTGETRKLESQVHFEFYATLPNMQIANQEMVSHLSNQTSTEIAKSHEQRRQLTDKNNKSFAVRELDKKSSELISSLHERDYSVNLKNSTTMVNADELEKEFAKTLKQNTYIIQLKTLFTSLKSAKRYSEKFPEYKAKIAPTKIGNKLFFLVELGPFRSYSKVFHVHEMLQKQGIKGSIR